nr:hypothetical protein [Tanacetum cinerariifolium]
VRDVSEGEACPTDSGFIADQDRATIAKSSTLPHDSATRVTSPATDEGNMQHNISELMALCTSLQRQYSELLAKFQAQEEEIVRLKERLVQVEDVYVQALQVKHPIIDWKVHTEGQRSYWQIIRLGGSSACYKFFVDLLKQPDREDS